jgi:hypothetical protein
MQELGGLRGGEAQVGLAQFGQVSPATEARDGQGGIGACGDHQVHIYGEVVEQKGDGLMDWLHGDEMIVVQDQDKVARQGADLINQRSEQLLNGWGLS